MSQEINARRIVKKYRGTQLVYEDTVRKWQDLKLVSPFPETIQYMDTGSQLIFKGKSNSMYYVSRNENKSMPLLVVPDQYNGIALSDSSTKYLYTSMGSPAPSSHLATLKVLENTILISPYMDPGFGGVGDTYLTGIILDYTK